MNATAPDPQGQPISVDAQDIVDRLSREVAALTTRAVMAEAARDAYAARLDEAMAARLQGEA